jgi:regulator of replication initiation timing
MELIKVENDIAQLNTEVSKKIAEFEKKIKEIKEQEDFIKQNILEEMEKKNLIKIETDDIAITYVAPTDRETFDSKTFRQNYSDLYDEYVKLSPVKSCIKIKVK